MTGCELDLIKILKKELNSLKNEESEKEVIHKMAKSIASQTGLAIDIVEDRLLSLLQENNQNNNVDSLKNIKNFFKVDGIYDVAAYTKARRYVRHILISALLNQELTLVRTDDDVNNAMINLQKKALRNICLKGTAISPLAYYINMTKDSDTWKRSLENTVVIAQYLIAAHLPTIVESWMSDLIKYDINTQKYSLFVDPHIRKDWSDDPNDKEAELNSYLEVLCKNTVLHRFDINGNEIQAYENMSLTKNAFFAAMNYELKHMPKEDYNRYIEDPYTIIDYLINKYKNIGAHSVLEENITHSFVYTWLFDEDGETNFYKNSVRDLSESTGYNPLDIFVKNIDKFVVNSYIEYDLSKEKNKDSILTLSTDESSKSYSRLADNITKSSNDLELEQLKTIILKDDKGKYYITDNYTIDQLKRVCEYFFGSNIIVDETNEYLFRNALQQIIDYRNEQKYEFFHDFLESSSDRKAAILSILNNINSYNPYSISGSVNNELDKALPTIGLSSVGSTIEQQIYRNRHRISKLKSKYTAAIKLSDSHIVIPVSPIEHTILYEDHEKNSPNNLFLGTVYRSTVSKEINGETTVKDCRSLSIPEAFNLSIFTDFLDKWDLNSDERVRIQAITPSDKTKIPLFEFSTRILKKVFGKNNKDIEKNVITQFRKIYGQYLLNTVNDFIQVLNIPNIELITNINEISLEEVLNRAKAINKYLQQNQINKTELYNKVYAFNKTYDLNKNITENLDFIEGENNSIVISPYMISTIELFSQDNPFDDLYLQFLKDIPNEVYDTKYLYNENGLSKIAKESKLYTYFLLKNVLSENILVNTVGVPLSHKAKGKDYYQMDSSAHITMVKRMVALTATMHPCLPTSLGGLSNSINMMTVGNDVAKMFAYSGNASSGNGFQTELEVADGAMFSLKFVDNLLKQSIADTKPKGIDLKLLMHCLDSEKGSAYLSKLASYGIDNKLLRCFDDPNIRKVNGINPGMFMELSTRTAKFRPESFNEDGKLIDYNGEEIDFDVSYKKDDIIYIVQDITYNHQTGQLRVLTIDNNGNRYENFYNDLSLYSFWKNILGGQYSCDLEGNYNEDSQNILSELLNKVGIKSQNKTRTDGKIISQNDVDQYLKKEVIHYFCTSSAQKSLKCPIVDIRTAIDNPESAWTVKMDIENFGIQMDPDHSAENASVKEITQLISFITEHGYVPDTVKSVYKNLAELVRILGTKVFVNFDEIRNPDIRKEAKQKLDNVFAKRLERIFSNPNEDVMGMANAIMTKIQNISDQYSNYLKPPYSDHQILGKLHTTVGSYLNKFISRTWNGRGDVLVPSHNMFMIYEDDDNTKFLFSDKKFLEDGSSVKASEYLHNKVWTTNEIGENIIRNEYIETHLVKPYEVMPVDVYYKLDTESGNPEVVVIDNWDILNNVRNNILAGIRYIRAIDLPRNLRSKRAYVDVIYNDSKVRVGLYHFKTLQEIAKIGEALNSNLNYNGRVWDKQALIKEKEKLQIYWEDVILPAIDKKEIKTILSEINSEALPNLYPTDISYVVFNEERATTNNYSSKFGIRDMNFSEIQQKKEKYFKEKLIDKFSDVGIKYDYLLYTANGTPTLVYTSNNPVINEFIELTPIIDEDGYRIDVNNEQLYKWPNNAKLYLYKYGNRSIEVIVTKDLDTLLDDNSFAVYRSDYDINRKNFYNLNNGNEDIIFDALALAQYESWKKTNTAVMARIPSQSLAFAMNIDTVAYLPYDNNISFVPNQQVFLQGSDYDIDKAYSIMAAVNNNGIYKDFNQGTFKIDNNLSIDDLTNTEVEVNTSIAEWIFNHLNSKIDEGVSDISLWINNILKNSNIRISEGIIINEILAKITDTPEEFNRVNNFLKIEKELNAKVKQTLKRIEMELYGLRGLISSQDDLKDSTQNFILESIKDVYNNPKTLYASTNPTTMEPINSAVKDMKLEANLRNHLNPATDIYVNQSTSVGKTDIGISAVAQKAFYAITYYNELKYENEESLLNITSIELPQDWVYDIPILFSLGFAGSRINKATYNELLNSIYEFGGIEYNNGRLSIYHYKNAYFIIETDDSGQNFLYLCNLNTLEVAKILEDNPNILKQKSRLIKIGDNLCDFVATTINASFISSATDNAKEMKLDLLNASPEILPAYEYLLSIGVTVRQAAKILTDPIIPKLITLSRGNLFQNKLSKGRMTNIFRQSLDELTKELFGENLSKYELTKIKEKLKILRQIFKGAQELTTIGTSLGINGGFEVQIGSPLLYQLNIEKSISQLAGSKEKFSIEKFFTDPAYGEYWIANLESKKQSYNLLDIIASVPHYTAMFEVPIQFKHIMQILSKDIDNTYSLIYNSLKYNYKIDDKVIRNVLRVVNDRKIFEFFIRYPFKYKSGTTLQQKALNGKKLLSSFEEILFNDPIELSTDSVEGLVTLKNYIENIIIPTLKRDFQNNEFVKNLIYNSQPNFLFSERVGAYASKINLSDRQYDDITAMIKSDFYRIQNVVINGHSIFEWMFIYDLLVYKHTINKNSLSILFDNGIDFENDNNIVTKWIRYVNECDNQETTYSKLSELSSMPGLELLRQNNDIDEFDYDPEIENIYKISHRPSWAIDPNYLPLFVKINAFENSILLNKNILSKAFAKGIIIVNLC